MNLIQISVTPSEMVALWNLRQIEDVKANPPLQLHVSSNDTLPPLAKCEIVTSAMQSGRIPYAILGEKRSAKNSKLAYVDILRELSILDPKLPAQLALTAPGSSRNHIAPTATQVYPRRPDLGKNSIEFAPGWYAGTNIADREKKRILRLACKHLGWEFGKDVDF